MLAGLVVRTGAMNLTVVLGDVKIDGPRPEFVGHFLVGRPKLLIRITILQKGVLGSVVTHKIEVSVGKVGLKTESLRHAHSLEQVEHILPAMHPGPANLTLGGQALAMIGCDFSGLPEGIDDSSRAFSWVCLPVLYAEFSGINPDDAAFAGSVLVEYPGYAASHFHRIQKLLLLLVGTHCGIPNGSRPDRSDQ